MNRPPQFPVSAHIKFDDDLPNGPYCEVEGVSVSVHIPQKPAMTCVNALLLLVPCTHPVSPCIHLYYHIYTCVHPLYMYTHHIHTEHTSKHPLNTLNTP